MTGYWEKRRTLKYYQEVLRLGRKYVPDGESLLDVGSRDCQYVIWFDWIDRKYTLDLAPPPELEGVIPITGDFMTFEPDKRFDLVLCLQVLEHLDNPAQFCHKLLSVGRFVIVSVPYKWPKGMVRYHKQDPVDELSLRAWTGKAWIEKTIVTDGQLERLVAVYKGNDGQASPE